MSAGIAIMDLATPFFFILAIFLLGTGYLYIRTNRLNKHRKSETEEDFLKSFDGKNISEEILVNVYRFLQDWIGVKNFSVHADDSLSKVYGIVNEDLDDTAIELLKICNCRVPAEEELRKIKPINTVGDLVRFVNQFKTPS